MKDNAKKVLGFLFLVPAISSRNLTSLALVAAFFGVYVAAGGKVTTAMPNVRASEAGFGDIQSDRSSQPKAGTAKADASAVTENPADEAAKRARSKLRFGKDEVSNPLPDQARSEEETKKDKKIKGSLNSLNERLNKARPAKQDEEGNSAE